MNCIDCLKPLVAVPILEGKKDAPFCNNPMCLRFGLITMATTEKEEVIETDEKTDKKDKHKKV